MTQLDRLFEVSQRYRNMLAEFRVKSVCDPDVLGGNPRAQMSDTQLAQLQHVSWMLDEIMDNPDQSITKKHRWLGFVQACLVWLDITDIQTERDATRDIFDGD